MSIHKSLIQKTIATSGWLILSCTVIFLLSKLFQQDDIALIKDLMGVSSTVLAALVALYIFQEWTVQKKLEALSNHSKEKTIDTPNLSIELLKFSTSLEILILKKRIYKTTQDQILFQHITDISADIYNYQFISISRNFDMSFKELKELMLQPDLKVYEALSENMREYNRLIFNKKILDLYSQLNDEDEETIKDLYSRTEKNLSTFHEKLISYKNFNYK